LELVKILRELSRRKRLVALVLGVAFLTGFLLAFRPGIPPQSRQYKVWLASSDILVDTRDSQVVAVGGRAPDLPTLAARANLVGNLMTSGPLKDAIAKKAGMPSRELTVVPPPNVSTPGIAPAPVKTPASRGVPDAEATILTLSTDETLPILHVVAQAPTEERARRLSGATIVGLRRYLGSVAAAQHIRTAHQLVVRQFGAPLASVAIRGLPRRFALAATIILALLGCGAIVGGSWFIRSWRQIEEAEIRGRPAEDDQGSADPKDESAVVKPLPESRPDAKSGPSQPQGIAPKEIAPAASVSRRAGQ
jgi:hypothetical protein